MKLKILVKIIEKILGMTRRGEGPRADMFLPDRLVAMALVFLAGGIACAIVCFIKYALWAVICAILGIALGAFALLCWRNQTIHVISDEKFT